MPRPRLALRAEAIGLQYTRGPRVDGYNVSTGRPISIVAAAAGAEWRQGLGLVCTAAKHAEEFSATPVRARERTAAVGKRGRRSSPGGYGRRYGLLATRGQRLGANLAAMVRRCVRADYRSRLSGWFPYPFGFILSCLAAVSTVALDALTQGVLAMSAACPIFSLLNRRAGTVRHYRQVDLPGAALSAVPMISSSIVVCLGAGICQHAVHYATTAASAAIAIGAQPASRPVMWLYAIVIMFSRVIVVLATIRAM